MQLINSFISNNKIFLYLSIFCLSLYQKIRNIEFVEYKYDQYFGENVIQNCNNKLLNFSNLEFLFIRSSSGVPQGPFHFSLECVSGILGINNYIDFLRIKIVFSQIIIFIAIYLLRNYLSELELFTFLLLILFNPYLIISARNTSIIYGYEFLLVIFLYLILNVNNTKKTQ